MKVDILKERQKIVDFISLADAGSENKTIKLLGEVFPQFIKDGKANKDYIKNSPYTKDIRRYGKTIKNLGKILMLYKPLLEDAITSEHRHYGLDKAGNWYRVENVKLTGLKISKSKAVKEIRKMIVEILEAFVESYTENI